MRYSSIAARNCKELREQLLSGKLRLTAVVARQTTVLGTSRANTSGKTVASAEGPA